MNRYTSRHAQCTEEFSLPQSEAFSLLQSAMTRNDCFCNFVHWMVATLHSVAFPKLLLLSLQFFHFVLFFTSRLIFFNLLLTIFLWVWSRYGSGASCIQMYCVECIVCLLYPVSHICSVDVVVSMQYCVASVGLFCVYGLLSLWLYSESVFGESVWVWVSHRRSTCIWRKIKVYLDLIKLKQMGTQPSGSRINPSKYISLYFASVCISVFVWYYCFVSEDLPSFPLLWSGALHFHLYFHFLIDCIDLSIVLLVCTELTGV